MFKWLKGLFYIPSQTFPPVPLKKPDSLPEPIKLKDPETYPGAWQLGDMCHECGWVVSQPRSWNIYCRYVCPRCGAIDPTQHEVVYRIHTLEIANTKLDHHMEIKK